MAQNSTQHLNKAKDEVKAAAGEVKRDAQNAAGEFIDRAKDTAGNVVDKTKDMASTAVDRAKDMASTAVDRAKDMASTVGQKAEDGLGTVAGGMTSLAGTIREHTPDSGMLHSVGAGAADALENSGRYLNEQGFKGMADDLTDLVRRNPIPALLVGVGLGFLLARCTSSRS